MTDAGQPTRTSVPFAWSRVGFGSRDATFCWNGTAGNRVRIVTQTHGSAGAPPEPGHGSAAARRPGYEQARDELMELVKRLEAGGLTLEQSLALWERGEELATICEEWLEGARARMATALARQDQAGEAHDAPF